MNRFALAAAALLMAASPAFASSCPKHVKAIDDYLAANPMTMADKATKAKALRNEGEALHNAGKHAESMAKLTEAEAILGIK
ncbi:MAG: hypothetical protein HZC25_15390 [Rhodospirillales bacterium]|nr:hypothetical protein [Rhodospirillales bacterium]